MMDDRQVALRAIPLIDLTDLSDDGTPARMDALVARALALPMPVAALCIWPAFVAQARAALGPSSIKLATVVNFPQGGEDVAAACAQTQAALADGADEIDLVLPWRALVAGRDDMARNMVRGVARALSPAAQLKVIIESGELPDARMIARASRLAIDEGANFIKTSTGKTAGPRASCWASFVRLEPMSASRPPGACGHWPRRANIWRWRMKFWGATSSRPRISVSAPRACSIRCSPHCKGARCSCRKRSSARNAMG